MNILTAYNTTKRKSNTKARDLRREQNINITEYIQNNIENIEQFGISYKSSLKYVPLKKTDTRLIEHIQENQAQSLVILMYKEIVLVSFFIF